MCSIFKVGRLGVVAAQGVGSDGVIARILKIPAAGGPLPVDCCMCFCAVRLLQVLSDHDRPNIEKRVDSIIKDNQRFQRVVVSRDEALGMFQENKFKVSRGPPGLVVGCSGYSSLTSSSSSALVINLPASCLRAGDLRCTTAWLRISCRMCMWLSPGPSASCSAILRWLCFCVCIPD